MNYIHKKKYEVIIKKPYLIISIISLIISGCFSDDKIDGDRQDLYLKNMDKFLSNEEKNIKLSIPKKIHSIKQVDNGPSNLIQHSSFDGLLKKLWTTALNKRGRISAPIFSGENIYILDGRANLYSLLLNGKKNWVINLAPKIDYKQNTHHSGGVIMHKDRLFVATGYGEIFCVDVSGSVKWKKRFDAPFRGSPIYYNNKIFVVTANDMAIALNTNGETIWTLEGATRPTLLSKGVSPALKNNKLLLPFSAGLLKAVRPNNGSELWTRSFDKANKGEAYSILGDFGGSPIIKSNRVFIVSASGQFLAVNLSNGKKLWSVPVGANSTPLINGGSIFVVSSMGKLVRISERDGSVIWSRNISKNNKKKNKFFGPTLAGNYLWITGTDGYLRKFDPSSGKQILENRLGVEILYRPYAVQNKLYVVTKTGKIIAFN